MPISALAPLTATGSAGPIGPAVPVAGRSPAGDGGFAASLASAVNGVQQSQTVSDRLNIQAVTGSLDDIQDATVAAARVSTEIQLFATVKNQAVDAFNTIMRMEA
ncbi:hypothetical protein ATY41_09815 [Leifsonia xyli subsp. xyli]|uniref:Flagellar hook-basal body complex protein FliE n=2 Tax=Leifsonia xyli subsp. xyli TaxID=59736 RepID=Q6AGA9_LEIXX|nr:flagellar hook-basal body complex protein FliE [Leifsonia xyli]AAT88586.1 flagellar basal-body protein [Leifsonia xyli subsp. xyli str. CTCB07]ODA90529.1 hypothetical protein ATY41_09815 [Leifsonia xyli subsp. xyli]